MTINWDTVASMVQDKLLGVLKDKGLAFVKENQADAIALGEDTVRGVLLQEYDKLTPIIPPLNPDATPVEISVREAILFERDSAFALVAAAELADRQAVDALRKKAVNAALGIAGTAAGIASTAAITALLKGK